MEKNIIVTEARQQAIKDLQQAIHEVQGAYRNLQGIRELQPLSTSIEDITLEWMKATVDKRLSLVEADMSLTEDERDARLGSWRSIKARSARYIHAIERVQTEWPLAQWQYDEQANNVFCSNMDEVVNDKASLAVPGEAERHWELICGVFDAVNRLRTFEKRHNVRKIRLEILRNIKDGELAEQWATKTIFYNDSVATQNDKTNRQYIETLFV